MTNRKMAFPVSIVVREKDGKNYAGFASQYPLNEGYKDVKGFGTWYGTQMSYQPFKKALETANKLAKSLNNEAGDKQN